MAIHFIGFKGEEYISAIKVWGKPDFFHRYYDFRTISETMKNDTVIFAKNAKIIPNKFNFNDSEIF